MFSSGMFLKTIIGIMLFALCSNSSASLKIEHWKTHNDVPVYFVFSPELPMVDIELRFRAGAIHDGRLPGLAAMTTALLRTGAKGMDVVAINEAFDSVGARLATAAGYDSIKVSLRSLTEEQYFDKSLETFKHLLSQPTFPAGEAELKRKQTLLSIRVSKENPASVANKKFRENIYPDHPYGQPVIGTEESVSNISVEDIRHYYKTYFTGGNMIITVVGAISRQELENIAAQIARSLPNGTRAQPAPPVPSLQEARKIHIPFPSKQAHVKIGQPLIEAGNPDFFALYLGNHILGGSGFGSQLMEEIRVKRGLAYDSSSYFRTRVAAGPFIVSFQTQTRQVKEATEIALRVLNQFIDAGPSDQEIELSRASIRNGFALRMTSNANILDIVSQIAFHDLGIHYLDSFLEKFSHLTAPEVRAAFQKHLHPEKMVTVIVGETDT